MNSEKSYVSPDDIKESSKSIPRPISIPSAVIGYIADLIIESAKRKVKKNISNYSGT